MYRRIGYPCWCVFREKEIEDINKAFEENNIVILNGVTGTGKTRLALHYAKKLYRFS